MVSIPGRVVLVISHEFPAKRAVSGSALLSCRLGASFRLAMGWKICKPSLAAMAIFPEEVAPLEGEVISIIAVISCCPDALKTLTLPGEIAAT